MLTVRHWSYLSYEAAAKFISPSDSFASIIFHIIVLISRRGTVGTG